VFGVSSGLHCLDAQGLKQLWKDEDQAFQEYASIIGSEDRLLVASQRGELMLVDAQADAYRLLARLKLFSDEPGIYSHPALVGKRLYLRSSGAVHCLELE
jgi:hypothetical protein